MKVYAVLAYHNYYPDSCNVKGMFTTENSAEEFLNKFKDECESIHKGYYDYYTIEEYTVQEGI